MEQLERKTGAAPRTPRVDELEYELAVTFDTIRKQDQKQESLEAEHCSELKIWRELATEGFEAEEKIYKELVAAQLEVKRLQEQQTRALNIQAIKELYLAPKDK